MLLEPAGDFADSQWTQGAKARDSDHWPTGLDEYRSSNHPAVHYCAAGHVERSYQETIRDSVYQPRLLTLLAREVRDSIPRWNDEPGRTPQEVRDLFRRVSSRLYRESTAEISGLAALPSPPAPAQPKKEALPAPAPAR